METISLSTWVRSGPCTPYRRHGAFDDGKMLHALVQSNAPVPVSLCLTGLKRSDHRGHHPEDDDPNQRRVQVVKDHFNAEFVRGPLEDADGNVQSSIEERIDDHAKDTQDDEAS